MNKMRRALVPLGALLVMTWSVAAIAAPQERVDVASRYRQAETVARIEEALAQKQMMVLASPDLQSMVSQFGAEIGGAQLVLFANPQMGGMLLRMDPAVGLEMPLKLFVYEKDGKVLVSYYTLAPTFSGYGNAQLAERGGMMDMLLKQVAEYAALNKPMMEMRMP